MKIPRHVEAQILSHLGYVDALAKQRIKYYSPVDLEDLIQAGRIGLVEAAKRFNPKMGTKHKVKFTTYAYNWINKYMIQEYIKARYPLHIPEKKLRKLGDGNRILHILEEELGREPTYNELILEMKERLDGTLNELEEVTRIVALGEQVYSLDKPIGEEAETTFADIIEEPDRVEDTLDDLLPEELSGVLSTLTPQEKRVLEVRFGIGVGQASSLEEVSKEFGVSKETIRRIEAKSLRKLRHPSRSRKLKAFVE
jgi:RNA polymerase primary sigma factor